MMNAPINKSSTVCRGRLSAIAAKGLFALVPALFIGCATMGDRAPDPDAPADLSEAELDRIESIFRCHELTNHECRDLQRFREEGSALQAKYLAGRPWLLFNGGGSTLGPPGKFLFVHESQRNGVGPDNHQGDVVAFMTFEHDSSDPERRKDNAQIRAYVTRQAQIPSGNLQVKRAREEPFPAEAYFPAYRTKGKSTAFVYPGGTAFARMTSQGIVILRVRSEARRPALGGLDVRLSRATWPWGETFAVGGDTNTDQVRKRRSASADDLTKKCEQGDAAACLKAARRVTFNMSLPKKKRTEETRRLAVLGCEGGNADSCDFATSTWSTEEEAHENRASLYAKACELRKDDFCSELVYERARWDQTEEERDQALTKMLTACGADHAPACRMVQTWVRRHQWEAGAALLLQQCEFGDAERCHLLASAYDESGKKKPDEFLPLYESACEQGLQESCDRLNEHTGKGQEQSRLDYYLMECNERHFASACVRAAQAYDNGTLGAEKDTHKANDLYETACARGKLECPRACQSNPDLKPCKLLRP